MFVYLSKNIFSCLEWKAETLPLGHEGQKRSNKCRYCWEKVRTTKITTSKTKKNSENSVDDQNVEMVFLVDQNVEMVFLVDQNVEKQIITTSKSKLSQHRNELITTTKITTSKRMKRTSKVSFLSDFHILTTYGVF